jgi:hypothetical protein
MQPIKNPTLPLTAGLTIPQMGFGTCCLGRKKLAWPKECKLPQILASNY